MKRLVVAFLLLVGLTLVGAHRSQADPIQVNGYCFAGPSNQLVSCTPTPLPGTPTPTAIPAPPVKAISVGAAQPGPDGTTSYLVGVTSAVSCFALPEPTILYLLGSAGSSVLTELQPTPGPSSLSALSFFVDQNPADPGVGTAQVELEVDNAALKPEGLDLKAVWPQEQREQIVNIVPATPPTATPTPGPGTATSTPTPSPTDTPTPTSTPTATPTPSITSTPGPTDTPTPIPAVTVRACVQPSVMNGQTLGGSSAELNGLTLPGASCTGAVVYLDSTTPSGFTGTAQVAGSDGFVSFPFNENTTAGGGVARVECTLGSQTKAACTGFLVVQSYDGTLSTEQETDMLTQIQSMVDTPAKCSTIFGS